MNIKEKARHITYIGSGLVPKDKAEQVLRELSKEVDVYNADIEMNGVVLIERQ